MIVEYKDNSDISFAAIAITSALFDLDNDDYKCRYIDGGTCEYLVIYRRNYISQYDKLYSDGYHKGSRWLDNFKRLNLHTDYKFLSKIFMIIKIHENIECHTLFIDNIGHAIDRTIYSTLSDELIENVLNNLISSTVK